MRCEDEIETILPRVGKTTIFSKPRLDAMSKKA